MLCDQRYNGTIYLLCTGVGSMYIELPLGVNNNPLPMHPIILYEIPCVFIQGVCVYNWLIIALEQD